MAIKQYTTNWIQTYTGRMFYPLEPNVKDVHIEDIAHALAMKCRFNGHSSEFYSVAQHSVLMSRYLAQKHKNNSYLLMWALLHDAGEAYLADVPMPVKPFVWLDVESKDGDRVTHFSEIEYRVRNAIFQRIAPGLVDTDEPELVQEVDLRILLNEAMSFMNLNTANRSTWAALNNIEPISEWPQLTSWDWKKSKIQFIEQFNWIRQR